MSVSGIVCGVSPDRSIPVDERKNCKFCGRPMTQMDLTTKNGGQRCGVQGCPGQMVPSW